MMKCFKRLVMHKIKTSLPNTLDPLQFAYRPNLSTDDAIFSTLHLALTHLEKKDSYVRMLFIDFSSAFNTIIPQQFINKLNLLGLNNSLCNWILDFLTGRPQSVCVGHNTSSTTTLSTGAPQGCVLSPLLFTLLTHDCTAKFSSNHIIKFADDTTVVGLISNNDETHYREEVAQLAEWCGTNNLSLNVGKTKEVVLDFRRNSVDHPPLTIDSSTVERVSSTKFLGAHITEDLTWTTNSMSLSKKAQQHLHFLRQLKRASLPPPILTTFYRGTIESVLTSCITVWYGNCSAADRQTLQRTVNTAAKIISGPLPSILDIFLARCSSKTNSIVKDPTHPSRSLFQLLPSGRRYWSIRARSTRLLNSFFPQAVRALNSNHPAPPLKPHANPYLLKHGPPPTTLSKHPPTLPHQRKKTVWNFFVQFKVNRWVGLYKPPVVTHSPLCALDTFHTLLCTQSHKRLSNICMFTCSCTTNHLALFPSQLLDSQCFSLHMYSIYVKHSYSLYFFFFFFF